MMKFLALRVYYSGRNFLSKTAKCLGGKSANELTHSLLNFEFLNPCSTKSIQYIRLIFTGRVNRTMTFQYSELISL